MCALCSAFYFVSFHFIWFQTIWLIRSTWMENFFRKCRKMIGKKMNEWKTNGKRDARWAEAAAAAGNNNNNIWKNEKEKRPNTAKTTTQWKWEWKCEKENIRQENERKITKVFLLSVHMCSVLCLRQSFFNNDRKKSVHKRHRICHTMSEGRKQSKSLV